VDDEPDLAEEILDIAIRPWAHRFVAAVLEQTDNPFYRAVVKLLGQLT
jgi:TorA maturation chaperone TorD